MGSVFALRNNRDSARKGLILLRADEPCDTQELGVSSPTAQGGSRELGTTCTGRKLSNRGRDRTSGKKCSLGFSEQFSSGRRIAIRPGTAYCWRAPLKTPFLAPAVTTRPWEGGKYFSMAIPSLRLREDITPHTFSHWATPLHKSYRVLHILASGVPKRCFTPILTHAHLAVGSQWHTPHVMGSKVSQLSQL